MSPRRTAKSRNCAMRFNLLGQNVARIENVLAKRLDTVSAQLEPLRDLTQIRKDLDTLALRLLGTLK